MNTGKLREQLRVIKNDIQVITDIKEMRMNTCAMMTGLEVCLDAIDIYKKEVETLRQAVKDLEVDSGRF